MYYGIDLGTTNSLIGLGDKLLTDLVSSNVDTKTKTQAKRDVIGEDIVTSYKTNMSMGTEGELSITCSSIILSHLAELATKRVGEKVKDVVISVPAYFQTSQREAVYEAAKRANLTVHALINEPTAAALYVCKDIKDLCVVYDLGGGTFDISIVDNRAGVYYVVATDGDNLGGDDLDKALCEEVFQSLNVPMRYKTAKNKKILKAKMRQAKEKIQKKQQDVFVDIEDIGIFGDYTLTVKRYKEIVKNVFGKTIDMTNYLVSEYIQSGEAPSLIMVGGSSNCPYLKEMIHREVEIKREITTDIGLDYVVAKGVALYASMLYEGTAFEQVNDVTKRLCVEDEAGRAINIIDKNSIIPCRNTIPLFNPKRCSKLKVKLYQGDSQIVVNNSYVGTLEFDYGREVEAGEGVILVECEASRNGLIRLKAYEALFGKEYEQQIQLKER